MQDRNIWFKEYLWNGLNQKMTTNPGYVALNINAEKEEDKGTMVLSLVSWYPKGEISMCWWFRVILAPTYLTSNIPRAVSDFSW